MNEWVNECMTEWNEWNEWMKWNEMKWNEIKRKNDWMNVWMNKRNECMAVVFGSVWF